MGAALKSWKRKRAGLYAEFNLNLSEELHVGFSVRVSDESVGLPRIVAEEENRRLIAIRTPLGPSHIEQE